MKMKWTEVLQSFKKDETEHVECIVILTDDTLLRNAFLAWQSVITKYDPELECSYNTEKEQWKWLWDNTQVDYKHYAMVCGVKNYDIKEIVERLKCMYLIYPDGTCNNAGRALIRNIVKQKLPKK